MRKANKKIAHLLMSGLVIIWGLDFVSAKYVLNIFEPITLVFFRYFVAVFVIILIKIKNDPGFKISRKDIKMFIACAFVGQVLYMLCEYSAMNYLEISLISLVISFTPIVSIIIERIIYRKKISSQMIGGITFSILGISLIIGVDFTQLFSGKILGYLFCFGAIMCANFYNFLTHSIGKKYSNVSLAFNQIICTLLITFPYAVTHLPDHREIDSMVVMVILFMGIVCAGAGFYIYIHGISVIGPTSSAVYMNFQPVSTTIISWLILGESIGFIQMIGGVIVIIAGIIVLKLKDNMENVVALVNER